MYLFKDSKISLEKPVLSIFLIGINVFLFFLILILEGYTEGNNWKFGSLHNVFITVKGEYFRFWTSLFLHANGFHLALNMFSLFMVGPFIEALFGRISFFLLYMLSGLGSTVASYFFTLSESQYPLYSSVESVGASGAIFGIVGGLLYFLLWNKEPLKNQIRKRLLIQLFVIISINLAFGFGTSYFEGGPKVDNAGHLGGLLTGFLIAYFLPIQILGRKPTQLAYALSLFLLTVLFASFSWAWSLYLSERIHLESWVF